MPNIFSYSQKHKYVIPRLISQITVNTVAQWCFQNIAVCSKIQAKMTQQHHPQPIAQERGWSY